MARPDIGRFSMIYKISGSITLMLALLVLGAWKFHTTVCMERTFNASVADVWGVWNDADSIKKWWGPKSYTALVVRNDVREGGSYLWAMKSEQGRMFWNTGTYKEVVANKKIVSTMSFSNENGKEFPARKYRFLGSGLTRSPLSLNSVNLRGRPESLLQKSAFPSSCTPCRRLVGRSSSTRFNCCSEEVTRLY